MTFAKALEEGNKSQLKHSKILEAVEAKDKEEAVALWSLITSDHISSDKVSLIISEELPKYTEDTKLHNLSARQILRIRKGLVK